MRLRKLILIFAALATVVLLAACGPSEQSGGEGSSQGQTQEATEKQAAPKQGSQEEPGGGAAAVEPPSNDMMKLTVPKMEQIKGDEIPTGLSSDEALFHDYAGVHIKHTGWPWEEVANVYITGNRLGYEGTNSYLAFWDLNKLREGDEIYITDSEGRKYTYVVYKKFIGEPQGRQDGKHPCGVETPNNLSELKPVEGKNIVTLQACTLPDFTNRLLVRGELKDISEV
jgi:sortase A